jgi:two-component system, NtrC family, sensor histidine kinase HydH
MPWPVAGEAPRVIELMALGMHPAECENGQMRWQRFTLAAALFFACAALAARQWDEYGNECELARETVANSADSVMNALVGGISSHRRLGPFFAEQVQGALDELVQSKGVQAAALVSEDGRTVLSAGDRPLLGLNGPGAPGAFWDEGGYRLVKNFHLPNEATGPGGGRGWGRRWQAEKDDSQSPFSPGKSATAILVVDRSRANVAYRHAAWTRGLIVAAGWLVVVCIALAWRATVRLAETRGLARVLEVEARHFRDLSQAAAGLAHETRNPLGLIRGWAQRLAETGLDSCDGRQKVQAVVEECDRVTARINQFLAFARPSEPKPARFDPADVLQELAALLEPDLSAKQVTLRGIAAGSALLADRELLRQALFNLLQNAIQAAPVGSCVETSLTHGRDGCLRIEVSDRGAGVPGEAVEKLFTPYFTTRPGGTGLGLAIVRRIAAAHGWTVGYSPRREGGATFWLDGIHG